jgi:LysR family glycine cleavage system transcriptional activator
VLRVNALATFTMRWLIPRLPSFQAANPAIEVRLSTSRDPIDSLHGDFDVVIRGGPDAVAGYSATEFLREHRVPVCSKALAKKWQLCRPDDCPSSQQLKDRDRADQPAPQHFPAMTCEGPSTS